MMCHFWSLSKWQEALNDRNTNLSLAAAIARGFAMVSDKLSGTIRPEPSKLLEGGRKRAVLALLAKALPEVLD